VVGLGPVGLELGQAMARLGVKVTGFDPAPSLGGLSDPDLLARLREALGAEMHIVHAQAEPEARDDGRIVMRWEDGTVEVDAVLAAIGRTPNLTGLGLEALGIALQDGRPADLPEGRLNWPGTRIYLAGDAGQGPALLHEASDEGRIAGYFAARGGEAVFRRRVPLRMVFCDPQIALAGATWSELEPRGDEIAVGEASFDRAGRIRLQREDGGALRLYAERATGRLLGAAILAPGAEHLAHLLAHAIGQRNDLAALLRMPAYHPTHEEVLRRALRRAAAECDMEMDDLEEIRCMDTPVECDAERGG
jgi:dihydrolipoamide dehydrogenase